MRRFRIDQNDALKIAIISIDPSRRKSGGALLGDRIRMNAINHANIYMRSLATRDSGGSAGARRRCRTPSRPQARPADVISSCRDLRHRPGRRGHRAAVDASLYVMTPEFGAASQLEKIDMLDFADFVAINKFDRKRARAGRAARRAQAGAAQQARRGALPDQMPVFGTMASRFADDGVTALYQAIAPVARRKSKGTLKLAAGKLAPVATHASSQTYAIVPATRALPGRDCRHCAWLSPLGG